MAKKQRRRVNRRLNGDTSFAQSRRALYDDVLSLAGTLMRGQKQYGADKINSLAGATREFAASIPEMPNLRVYVATAAERLEDLSGYVTATDFEDMVDDAGRLARQYPMATLGIAIAAGLGATRLLYVPSFPRPGRQRPGVKGRAKPRRKTSANGNQARAHA